MKLYCSVTLMRSVQLSKNLTWLWTNNVIHILAAFCTDSSYIGEQNRTENRLLLCFVYILSSPHFSFSLPPSLSRSVFSVIFDMSFWWQLPWLSFDLDSVINFVSSSFFLFLYPWFQQEPSVLDKVTEITGQGKLIFNVPLKTLPSAWPSEMCDKNLGKLHLCS